VGLTVAAALVSLLLAGVGHLVTAWLAAAGLRAPSRVAAAP
jgi:hypothetical protein